MNPSEWLIVVRKIAEAEAILSAQYAEHYLNYPSVYTAEAYGQHHGRHLLALELLNMARDEGSEASHG